VDAVRLMISDHHELERLFGDPDAESGDGAAGTTGTQPSEDVTELLAKLRAHMVVADEVLYPAVRARVPPFDLVNIKQAEDLLHDLTEKIDELGQHEPGSREFNSRVQSLREPYTRHEELEESAILPRAEDLLSDDELLKLGDAMAKRRARILYRPKIVGQIPLPEDPARVLKRVGMIILAGVALAVLGRMRRPMRTSGPLPLRR
jgi:hypothetical protein